MIQQVLNSYYANLKTPRVNVDDNILDLLVGPDIIWVSPEYEKTKPKIVIIGQQQRGWDYTYRDFINNWSIEEAVDVYKKFNFAENYFNAPFWQIFKQIREHYFGPDAERGIIAWLNLIKFVTIAEQSVLWQPFEEEALALQDGVFVAEINALKPDVCIFMTGPDYDNIIERYYDGVLFNDTGLGKRTFAKLIHPSLPERSFRTYHPLALRYQRKWEPVLQCIFESVA